MIDPANMPDVAGDELLARFVLFSKHIRNDRTLKPDAFMPHPYRELSVTRHLSATSDELWAVGQAVAEERALTLHGRGDFAASVCQQQGLTIEVAPLANNPNHADVTGWPAGKPEQKIKAQEIAAASKFVSVEPPV